jgi:membrane dipeptidase
MHGITRRELLGGGAAALLAGSAGAHAADDAIPADVLAFHRECRVLDLHIDTPLWMRLAGYDIGRRHRNRLPASPFGWHLDLPRAAEGGLDAAVFGLVINPAEVREELMLPLRVLAWTESGFGIAQTLETLDLVAEAEQRLPDRFRFARTGSELRAAIDAGRFAALAGLEGAQGIEGRLENVARAHAHGLRMLGLVHFQATEAAYPMTVAAFEGRGLTPFGRDLVAECERLRIVVDLAHTNAAGVDDALALVKRPFVVSHSACRAVQDHPRNLTDDQIRRLAERGGVIGVAVERSFVGDGGLERFLDHLEHLMRVGGVGCAALGSDYDGAIVPVPGMEDVTAFPRVTAGLLARGHPQEAVKQVMGENALRVLTEVCG